MSAAWSVLIIAAGGISAIVVYLVNPGREHLRGAEQLVEAMRPHEHRYNGLGLCQCEMSDPSEAAAWVDER